MWTKFQIKSQYYKNENQHFCVYYECDTDEAQVIRKLHSRVFEHYEFVGNIPPAIENIENYRDTVNRFHQIYHKEDFERLTSNHY